MDNSVYRLLRRSQFSFFQHLNSVYKIGLGQDQEEAKFQRLAPNTGPMNPYSGTETAASHRMINLLLNSDSVKGRGREKKEEKS